MVILRRKMTIMYHKRLLIEKLKKSRKSILLLGPRQTGKSTLIQKFLEPDLQINLSHEPTYLSFASNASELEERLEAHHPKTVFIDEVQRIPSLLNTIQSLMDAGRAPRFLLTGSSARKLRRGKANLLPGRIHTYYLGPLCSAEMEYRLDDQKSMELGTLPGIYLSEDSRADQIKTLESYASTYLREEIQAEALTENLEGFSRFLFVTARWSGQFLDFSKMANESQISRTSAIRYFEILEDTLVVNRCVSFSKTGRARLVKHPKYYFFDTGVWNGLMDNFRASEDRKGILFEHLFFNQILSSAKAHDINLNISTYRTEKGSEVDFIVERNDQVFAIELKSGRQVGPHDLKGLKGFAESFKKPCRSFIAMPTKFQKKVVDGIHIFPWQEVLQEMGL